MFGRLRRRVANRNSPSAQAVARQAARTMYRVRAAAPYNGGGIDVFDRDWDTLLLLDACRHDAFTDHADLSGTTSAVTSRASATPEWLHANVAGRDLTDTVYVTGNGQYLLLRDELDSSWHAVDPVLDDALVDETGTNLVAGPDDVTARALAAAAEYPRKRLVVHYVQPHAPYLGPVGRERFDPGRSIEEIGADPATSADAVRAAYRENLELVLDSVETLLDDAERSLGRVVVSADHGELLGERVAPLWLRQWGHPPAVYHPSLVKVPWHVHDHGERPEVDASSAAAERSNSEDVAEHLAALGYQ